MDVFEAEASEQPLGADVEEVVNYVRAMEIGLQRLETLPLSTRLIREMHAVILAGVRGRERQPGQLRTTQNWVGPAGATIETAPFVPPPPSEVGDLLTDLERFIHEQPLLPPLVQAALLHYQFETIHPFLDGNGRLGRLLIVFFLVVRGRLPEPLLYLSPFSRPVATAYYDSLQAVRERGDVDAWVQLFLEAVTTQAADAVLRAERLLDLQQRYRTTVRSTTTRRGDPTGRTDHRAAGPDDEGRGGASRHHPPGCPEGAPAPRRRRRPRCRGRRVHAANCAGAPKRCSPSCRMGCDPRPPPESPGQVPGTATQPRTEEAASDHGLSHQSGRGDLNPRPLRPEVRPDGRRAHDVHDRTSAHGDGPGCQTDRGDGTPVRAYGCSA